MRLFLGLDGGQSSTQAALADETGRILGRGSAGPADEVNQGPDSTRLRDALEGALAAALAAAGLPPETELRAAVAGISGYEGRIYGQPPRIRAGDVTLVHDTRIAHAGALAGEPGVVVIAGTGSVAYGAGPHGEALTGGWGYLFGDEGSAFWLARTALMQAMREQDAGESPAFAAAALEALRMPSLRALSRAFYTGGIDRAALAALAPMVLHAAETGDAQAETIVRDGANALAIAAMYALRRSALPDTAKVAIVGGVAQNQTMVDQFAQRLRALLPQAQPVKPRYGSAEGALLLAFREAGVAVSDLT
ncbi:MAG TPA: BadF/BadG/BcrA/BcrD ATPase family protein [Candidatus Baltobacteraceae bacterium]|nr:BadF/BadG/BcrA/BcrD ATPase family protein [Candidatus Baltobacteraceae bacterium]